MPLLCIEPCWCWGWGNHRAQENEQSQAQCKAELKFGGLPLSSKPPIMCLCARVCMCMCMYVFLCTGPFLFHFPSPPLAHQPGSSRTEPFWVPCTFHASQLSLSPVSNPRKSLRELLAQSSRALELSWTEASLQFPGSSSGPSHQRRSGTGRPWAEHLQRRAWASQEQCGPSSLGGAVGRIGCQLVSVVWGVLLPLTQGPQPILTVHADGH